MSYRIIHIKRKTENLVMLPFIGIGRLIARLRPLQQEYHVFYFFPFYHTGGAEKLHAQLTAATGDKNCILFFTRKSQDPTFLQAFRDTGCEIRDISRWTDNKWIYWMNFIYRGIITGYINRQSSPPLVFNGQSNFGYKISPWIRKPARQVELIHAWNTFSLIRIPYAHFYTVSLTVSQQVVQLHQQAYDHLKLPSLLTTAFRVIGARIPLPPPPSGKNYQSGPLVVLYVGRSTPEKRPVLFARLAAAFKHQPERYRFEMAGDVKDVLPAELRTFCHLHGDITNPDQLQLLYLRAHVVVIPSLTESGPLVLMEGMAAGCAILSTPVGIVPDHLSGKSSGRMTRSVDNEEQILEEMTEYLQQLADDRNELQRTGEYNIQYAQTNFGIEHFNTAYRRLFEELNPLSA